VNAAPVVHANGAAIPAIGLGTGRLRGDVAVRAIAAALDLGYRHIDTAAKYGNEVEVGEALRGSAVARHDLFLTTKALPAPGGDAATLSAVESSLKRLGVDHVDLLLIHWPDQQVPLEGQVHALCRARREGLARHVGFSNFPPRYVEAGVRLATEPVAVNQIECHPYFRQDDLEAACRRHGIAASAYCPLGRGALLDDPVIADIAAAYGRTPAQVILRWHLEHPKRLVVPSSRDPQRLAQNLDVLDFRLTTDDHRRIDCLSRPNGRVVRGPTGFDWEGEPR
jgi:diketogulonate reductase-like aldo/keto reductase